MDTLVCVVAGTLWTLVAIIGMLTDNPTSGTWQQVAIGAFLASSGLYGLLTADRDE